MSFSLTFPVPPLGVSLFHSTLPPRKQHSRPALDREVHADMAFLADDELHGRGSATRDEHIAALFAAAQFQSLGLEPGGDNGTFVQRVPLPAPLPPPVRQRLEGFENTPRTATWNAIAILRGSDPAEKLFCSPRTSTTSASARPTPPGDTIYNGADDDASGTTAVLALAQAFARFANARAPGAPSSSRSSARRSSAASATRPSSRTRPSRSAPSSPTWSLR